MAERANLDAFLKDQALVRRFRRLKQPENWVPWIVLVWILFWPNQNLDLTAKFLSDSPGS